MKKILSMIYFVIVCVPLACLVYVVAISLQEAKSILSHARQQKQLRGSVQNIHEDAFTSIERGTREAILQEI